MSPSEFLERYFHGISLSTKDGRCISTETIIRELHTAQNKVEEYLAIKLTRQVIEERTDFLRGEYFDGWGHLRANYPVFEPITLTGYISTTKQTEFPLEWISVNTTNQEDLVNKNLHIVPAGGSTPTTNAVIFSGITPNAGFLGVPSIPNYWNLKYVTGFTKVPDSLLSVVGKLASMAIFAVLGDIVLGAGIASQSLSFDSLSQSIATTQSAENSAYSARIRQYAGELKIEMHDLKGHYKGITFLAM